MSLDESSSLLGRRWKPTEQRWKEEGRFLCRCWTLKKGGGTKFPPSPLRSVQGQAYSECILVVVLTMSVVVPSFLFIVVGRASILSLSGPLFWAKFQCPYDHIGRDWSRRERGLLLSVSVSCYQWQLIVDLAECHFVLYLAGCWRLEGVGGWMRLLVVGHIIPLT